ncbi:MAG: hypothetical protein ACFCGT_02250 [Sandaracinaceae bacterium]
MPRAPVCRGAAARSALLLALAAAACPARAAADNRVWAQEADDEDGDGEPDGEPERWLDLTAFAQPGFIARLALGDENSPLTDSGWFLQRARTGLRARLDRYLLIRIEVELTPTALLQDAYLDIPILQELQIRLGQFLVPSLRVYSFNELNLGFIDRPIYVPVNPDRNFLRYLSPRDIGGMFFGYFGDLSPDATLPVLEYRAGAFVGRGANVPQNNDDVFLLALRLQLHVLGFPRGEEAESDIAYSLRPRLGTALSLYSNCDDRGNWNRGFTVDAELRFRGLYASAGWVWYRNSPGTFEGGAFLATSGRCPGNPSPNPPPDDPNARLDFVSRGGHVQVQYVLPRPAFPLDGMNLELLVRADYVDPASPHVNRRKFGGAFGGPLFGGGRNTPGYVAPANYTDSDNPPSRYRFTFGINYFPTGVQSLRFGINYQLNLEAETVVTPEGTIRAIRNDILWLQLTAGL